MLSLIAGLLGLSDIPPLPVYCPTLVTSENIYTDALRCQEAFSGRGHPGEPRAALWDRRWANRPLVPGTAALPGARLSVCPSRQLH